ncbi:hypothetical protein E1B28_002409 [Marasmius oreades]|uniref:Uncharacterized protein n=1 Tax=Marasmius oreades TaxID=181124 RepID=A0A9P7RMZ8_9AGAR|nr:uncharacterized protein E1B28_002409 [Marasmius oreades]KAG7086457.1 hypothetical protein E1B28_002409 [Marasmius oreades]
MSLTLNVNIDPAQVDYLQKQGYDLFLAKLVDGQAKANVIWKSNSKYIATNNFKWQPVYAIAGSETVEPGTLVSASTTVKPIGYGQSIEISETGTISNPSGTVAPGKAFTLTNNDPNLRFSAAVYSVDPTKPGAALSNPFFVSKSIEHGFHVSILPVETVVLWFGQHQETSTIIADYSGPALTVVYGKGDSTHTAQWTKDGNWELVN